MLYNIILKVIIFGENIMALRKTTKLIEGIHRGLQEWTRGIYVITSKFFLTFFYFCQNPKSRDFLRFFAMFSTFSRTMGCMMIVMTSRQGRQEETGTTLPDRLTNDVDQELMEWFRAMQDLSRHQWASGRSLFS